MKVVELIAIDSSNATSNVTEDDAPEWSAGSYDEGAQVVHLHRVWESLYDANTDEPGTGVQWFDMMATNPYRMFDGVIGRVTTRTGTIVAEMTPAAAFNAAGFWNLRGGTIRLEVDDPSAGVVYDQTRSLLDNSEVDNIHTWLFAPIRRLDRAFFTDIPPFPNAIVRVTIDAGDEVAQCGEAAIGWGTYAGDLQLGWNLRLRDFSTNTRDRFGNFLLEQLDASDSVSFPVRIDRSRALIAKNLYYRVRAKPAFYIGADHDPLSAVLAVLQDFELVAETVKRSSYSLKIESLI